MNDATIKAISAVEKVFPLKGFSNHIDGSYRTVAETVCKYLPKDSCVLDFGCGSCDKIAILSSLGYSCAGCDDFGDPWYGVESNRVKFWNFVNLFGLDVKHLKEGYCLPFPDNYFSMVMLHDVLEHLHDSPRRIMIELLRTLRPRGYVFITVPNAANIRKRLDLLCGRTNMQNFDLFFWGPDPWRGHVREYVRTDCELLCRYLDLSICELRTCHHMLRRLPANIRPLYKLATRIFPDWRDTWLLVAQKPTEWKAPFLTEKERQRILGPFGWDVEVG